MKNSVNCWKAKIWTMNKLYDFYKKVLNHANQQPSIGLTTNEGSETNS